MNLVEVSPRQKITSGIEFTSFIDTNIDLDTLEPSESVWTEEVTADSEISSTAEPR